jgi:hypothetical protein
MNKIYEIIKKISKKSERNCEKNLYFSLGTKKNINYLLNQNLIEIINENEKNEFNNRTSRNWRFIPNTSYFMNNIGNRLINTHQLKYMSSVNLLINDINKSRDDELVDDYNLVIFVDIDNWGRFFQLPNFIPQKTFVYGFKGGKNLWKAPIGYVFLNLI